MLRAEVQIATFAREDLGAGTPQLVVRLKGLTPGKGWTIDGVLILRGLSPQQVDEVEDFVARRHQGKATLCIGPIELNNVLSDANFITPLRAFMSKYGLTPDELAHKAAVGSRTLHDLVNGHSSKPYSTTRRKLTAAMLRIANNPTPGETLRYCRTAYVYSEEAVAHQLRIRVEDVRDWESDHKSIPEQFRPALAVLLGLPPWTWANEHYVLPPRESPRYHAFLERSAKTRRKTSRRRKKRTDLAGLSGRDILELRHVAGLSQVQLAEHLGCSRATIYFWEKGLCCPGRRLAVKLRKLFALPKGSRRAGITGPDIRAARQAAGLSIGEAARLAGIPYSSFHAYEQGKFAPGPKAAEKLRLFFRLDKPILITNTEAA